MKMCRERLEVLEPVWVAGRCQRRRAKTVNLVFVNEHNVGG